MGRYSRQRPEDLDNSRNSTISARSFGGGASSGGGATGSWGNTTPQIAAPTNQSVIGNTVSAPENVSQPLSKEQLEQSFKDSIGVWAWMWLTDDERIMFIAEMHNAHNTLQDPKIIIENYVAKAKANYAAGSPIHHESSNMITLPFNGNAIEKNQDVVDEGNEGLDFYFDWAQYLTPEQYTTLAWMEMAKDVTPEEAFVAATSGVVSGAFAAILAVEAPALVFPMILLGGIKFLEGLSEAVNQGPEELNKFAVLAGISGVSGWLGYGAAGSWYSPLNAARPLRSPLGQDPIYTSGKGIFGYLEEGYLVVRDTNGKFFARLNPITGEIIPDVIIDSVTGGNVSASGPVTNPTGSIVPTVPIEIIQKSTDPSGLGLRIQVGTKIIEDRAALLYLQHLDEIGIDVGQSSFDQPASGNIGGQTNSTNSLTINSGKIPPTMVNWVDNPDGTLGVGFGAGSGNSLDIVPTLPFSNEENSSIGDQTYANFSDEVISQLLQDGATKPSLKPDSTARPLGTETPIEEGWTPAQVKSAMKEDANARTLRQKYAYNVIQNPTPQQLLAVGYEYDHTKLMKDQDKPDFIIEGGVFDQLFPESPNPQQVYKGLKAKVDSGQASRILLDLGRTDVTWEQVKEWLEYDYANSDAPWQAIEDIAEIIVMENGEIIAIWVPKN